MVKIVYAVNYYTSLNFLNVVILTNHYFDNGYNNLIKNFF